MLSTSASFSLLHRVWIHNTLLKVQLHIDSPRQRSSLVHWHATPCTCSWWDSSSHCLLSSCLKSRAKCPVWCLITAVQQIEEAMHNGRVLECKCTQRKRDIQHTMKILIDDKIMQSKLKTGQYTAPLTATLFSNAAYASNSPQHLEAIIQARFAHTGKIDLLPQYSLLSRLATTVFMKNVGCISTASAEDSMVQLNRTYLAEQYLVPTIAPRTVFNELLPHATHTEIHLTT